MNQKEFLKNKKRVCEEHAHAVEIVEALKFQELYELTFFNGTSQKELIRVKSISSTEIHGNFLAGTGTEIHGNFLAGTEYGGYDPTWEEIAIVEIKSVEQVPIKDLPLYISWPVKSSEFMRLIKKGL